MNLRPDDMTSPTWARLKKDLNARLDELRRMNDAPSLTTEQTALIRGQIKEVKRILALSIDSASEGGGADA